MIIIIKILLVINLAAIVKCNPIKLIDKWVKVSDITKKYCPAIGVCVEGTHVMCRYYNAEYQHGPLCHNVQNITMMPVFAERILEIINDIRSRTAKGLLHDRNGKSLPKGYGIFKVEWEEELATFAQVWANQCTLTKDRCRASGKCSFNQTFLGSTFNRFPDPGQTGGVYRFSKDDSWDLISSNKIHIKFTEPGFTDGRVLYAIYYILRSQFSSMLKILTPELIANITDQTVADGNGYLQLFFGTTRYVGCGVSAFKEYAYKPEHTTIYNSVFLVCNYSKRLRANNRLYLTEKPTEEGYSDVLGCPPGFVEDTYELLCYESVCKQHCKNIPNLVVLPIFDIEDKPYRDSPKYRLYPNMSRDVLDLGIIRKPGAHDTSNVNLRGIIKDQDFIENKINNVVEDNTGDQKQIRRNQILNQQRRNIRHRNVERNVNYKRDGVKYDVIAILDQLKSIIEKMGDNERRVIGERLGSIQTQIAAKANAYRQYEDNYPNIRLTVPPVVNYIAPDRNQPIADRNYNQNIQQYTPNNFMNSIVRNTHDIRHNHPIRCYGNKVKATNTQAPYNREENYGVSQQRRYFGDSYNENERTRTNSEVDRLMAYDNREQYRKTL